MVTASKTHLLRPHEEITMCGRSEPNLATREPDDVDCKTCRTMYEANPEWYKHRTDTDPNPVVEEGLCMACGRSVVRVVGAMTYHPASSINRDGSDWCEALLPIPGTFYHIFEIPDDAFLPLKEKTNGD